MFARRMIFFWKLFYVFYVVWRIFYIFRVKMTWIRFEWNILLHRFRGLFIIDLCIRFKYPFWSFWRIKSNILYFRKKKEINDLKIIKFNFLSNQTMSLERLFFIFQNYNFSHFFFLQLNLFSFQKFSSSRIKLFDQPRNYSRSLLLKARPQLLSSNKW